MHLHNVYQQSCLWKHHNLLTWQRGLSGKTDCIIQKVFRLTELINGEALLGVCWSHTCVFDIHAAWQTFAGVAVTGSKGCVHADDVTVLTGLDGLNAVSLSGT